MKKTVFLFVTLAAIVFAACEKEDEGAPYTGQWETAVYPSIDPLTQSEISQQMLFDFEEEAFEANVYNSDSAGNMNVAMGVRGDILNEGASTMNVELTEVGINATGRLTWYSKLVPQEEPFFNEYIVLVSSTIPEEFEATYVIDGEKLDLIIPAMNDTIHLFKK